MNAIDQFLTAQFGPHCGLNADFGVAAWRVAEWTDGESEVGLFILDEENDAGSYVLTRRTIIDDESQWRDYGSAASMAGIRIMAVCARSIANYLQAKGITQ